MQAYRRYGELGMLGFLRVRKRCHGLLECRNLFRHDDGDGYFTENMKRLARLDMSEDDFMHLYKAVSRIAYIKERLVNSTRMHNASIACNVIMNYDSLCVNGSLDMVQYLMMRMDDESYAEHVFNVFNGNMGRYFDNAGDRWAYRWLLHDFGMSEDANDRKLYLMALVIKYIDRIMLDVSPGFMGTIEGRILRCESSMQSLFNLEGILDRGDAGNVINACRDNDYNDDSFEMLLVNLWFSSLIGNGDYSIRFTCDMLASLDAGYTDEFYVQALLAMAGRGY